MKQPKKLSFVQKKIVQKLGLNPFEWMCHFEDKSYLHIVHKTSKEIKIIGLQKGELVSNGN